jgi:hypothetical protein
MAAVVGLGADGCSAAPQDSRAAEDPGAASSAVLGPTSYDSSCNAADIPNIQIAYSYGRIAANSPAFAECINKAFFKTINIPGKGGGIDANIGPYNACSGDPPTPGPSTVLENTVTANPTKIACNYIPGTTNAGSAGVGGVSLTDSVTPESITLQNYVQWFQGDAAPCFNNPKGLTCAIDQKYAETGAVIYHEIMHQHGYDHFEFGGHLCGIPASENPSYANSVPYQVQECLRSVLEYSYSNCSMHDNCGFGSGLKLQSSVFSATPTCSCVSDAGIVRNRQAAGNPAGYARSDPTSSVVYRGPNGDAKELYLVSGGGWGLGDLTAVATPAGLAPPAASDLASYVQSDQTNSVVYRAANNDVYELSLNPSIGTWEATDLSFDANKPPAAVGNPGAYARSDGVGSALYRGTDNHVHELAWVPDSAGNMTLEHGDLTTASRGANAAGDPYGYVRADSVNAVVYLSSDSHVREMALVSGFWVPGDLTAVTGAHAARGRPRGYSRSDHASAVVYRGTDNHVYELSLAPLAQGWAVLDLTANSGAPTAVSDPVPYVRADNFNAVVYRGVNGHIYELDLGPGDSSWFSGDLTAIAGAPVARDTPGGYVRADGINAVIFRSSSDNHIHELSLLSGWADGDLTVAAGAGP